MQHIPNGAPVRVRIGEPINGGPTVEDCISCHARGAYNLLVAIIGILRPIAIRRRHGCNAAGACSNTGLPMLGIEPPYTEECECLLMQEFACGVLDIGGQLEVLSEKADRLARMLDQNSYLQEH